MVSSLHNLNLAGAIKLLRQAQQSYIKLQVTMSEFQNYNGPIIDVWANWWGDNFFVKFPRFKELYERIGIEQRMANSSKTMWSYTASFGGDDGVRGEHGVPHPGTNGWDETYGKFATEGSIFGAPCLARYRSALSGP